MRRSSRLSRRASVTITIVTACWVAASSTAFAAAEGDDPPAYDWGTRFVTVAEWWSGAMAGYETDRWQPGLRFWRPEIVYGDSAITDLRVGWTTETPEGRGLVAMLEGPIPAGQRVEVFAYGRRGNVITLAMVLHPDGVLPWDVQQTVRRKRGDPEDAGRPVTLQDAAAVGVEGQYVFVAAPFADDLPTGSYRVVLELRDPAGAVLQRHERELTRTPPTPDPLESLSDEALLEEYVRRGEALRGTGVAPNDSGFGLIAVAYVYRQPAYVAWRNSGDEIVRRGERMVPLLMQRLEGEAVRNPAPSETPATMGFDRDFTTPPFGFAADLMRRLAQIGDPRPVPLLVQILDGMDGKANQLVRLQAEAAAARLTGMDFLLHDGGRAEIGSVLADGALRLKRDESAGRDETLRQVAGLYRNWLAMHGERPKQWRELACQQARAAIEGDDADALRAALDFLAGKRWGPRGHDDDPPRTIDVIVRRIDRAERRGGEAGRELWNLRAALALYGPLARPHVDRLISSADPTMPAVGFRELSRVGGERALDYLVSVLPELAEAAEGVPPAGSIDAADHDPQRQQARSSYDGCRWAIERIAGRSFADDAAIAAWWQQARAQGQERWLAESLEITVAQADAGDAKAQYLARLLLPDLPHPERDLTFDEPPTRTLSLRFVEQRPPFRQQWLAEHRERLRYDPLHARWVLSPVEAPAN